MCSWELFRLILGREEPKQRFTQETDARIGITGVRILDGYIHWDLLAPSTKYGSLLSSNLYPAGSLVPADIAVPALTAAQTAISGYPASTTCHVGEPFFWLNLDEWKFRPSSSAKFRHYFKGPIPSQESPDLEVMFYREELNWYTPFPQHNKVMVGFGA